jgi:hypothetical protein
MAGKEGVGLFVLLAVLVADVIVLVLGIVGYIPAWPFVFLGLAYVAFFATMYTYFSTFRKDGRPGYLPKVVSLGRQCPETVDDVAKCLAERVEFTKWFAVVGLPVAAAELMLLTHSNVHLFAVADALFILSLTFALWIVAIREGFICRDDIWGFFLLALAASFIAVMAIHVHIYQMHSGDLQKTLISCSTFAGFFVYFVTFFESAPIEPNIYITKTYVQDAHTAYKRFVEDLGDEPICELGSPLHPDYLKLKRVLCERDLETAKDVEESFPLIILAHHFIAQGELELARRLMDILRSRNLDEKERAALEILEVLYAVANTPCGDREMLMRYVEKINSIDAPGWSRLLKILALIHLDSADKDYTSTVKMGILRTIDRCTGDNLSIYYYALKVLEKAKPLCKSQ